MKYPDGTDLKEGDIVWWNEGGSVGHVQKIIATPEQQKEWGLKGPAAFFGNQHPYHPDTLGICYPFECFENEGIAKLPASSLVKLAAAFTQALSAAPTEAKRCAYSVRTRSANNRMVEWIFQFEVFHGGLIDIVIPADDSWVPPSNLRTS